MKGEVRLAVRQAQARSLARSELAKLLENTDFLTLSLPLSLLNNF